ncbi:MAG: nucleotidyltransferase domain-containing protein [Lentisphaeria bacterium]|nr:nucleotidyltransferase domain-containing protein [Lentisphaeria bacterium]
MIDLESWLERFAQSLRKTFGERVWFAGLQGSYARGEATDSSDIDLVVILDALTAEDIASYGAMLDSLDHRELVCGFLSGKEELLHWEPSELFQFCRDTKPIIGSLDDVLALVKPGDIDRAILTGACGVYHACVHNMLYEKDEGILRNLYKTATFSIRATTYRRTGIYCSRLDELLQHASAADKEIVQTCLAMKSGVPVDFSSASRQLFAWAKVRIVQGN